MNPVRELHHQAMDLAELAFVGHIVRANPACEQYKTPDEIKELNRQAMLLEKEAAGLCQLTDEPTRSILYRSAAWLAVHCEDFGEARKLVETGLAGNPPGWAVTELNEVLGAVVAGNKE